MVKLGYVKPYYCIDTFSGFTKNHADVDIKLGMPKFCAQRFRRNSIENVRKNLQRWGVSHHVELIEADISEFSTEKLPENISICLMDVDLKVPTSSGLEKIYSRLHDNGVILIDDCKKGTAFIGADLGYKEFMQASDFDAKYFMGMGVVEKKPGHLNWSFAASPLAGRLDATGVS